MCWIMGIACSSLHLLWHPIAKEITLKVHTLFLVRVGCGYEVSVSSFDRFSVNKHTRVGWLYPYMTIFNWENKPVGREKKNYCFMALLPFTLSESLELLFLCIHNN